jgi:hypothetical protein
MMANVQQPTRRTRHIEIKHYALLDWVEQDLLILQHISTHGSAADAMTKTLSRQLLYRHYDTYMGNRIPEHIRSILGVKKSHLLTTGLEQQKHNRKSVQKSCGTPCSNPEGLKDWGGTGPILT